MEPTPYEVEFYQRPRKDIWEPDPYETMFFRQARYLPYEDILKLCQTNPNFRYFCSKDRLYKILLERDYGVKSDPENLYKLYISGLDFLSKFYPVITQKALQAFVQSIPISDWSGIEAEMQKIHDESPYEHDEYLHILSLSDLVEISDVIDNYLRPPDFETLYPGLNQMVETINPNQYKYNEGWYCDSLKRLVSRPTPVYINKKLVMVNYDYDLASKINDRVHGWKCTPQLLEIAREILSLAGVNF